MTVHDVPSAADLVDSVRRVLARDILPELAGRPRYDLRIALHLLEVVERQLRLGPALEAECQIFLAPLDVASPADLATRIRTGALDERLDDVRAYLLRSVQAKLSVANPGYLERHPPPADSSPDPTG